MEDKTHTVQTYVHFVISSIKSGYVVERLKTSTLGAEADSTGEWQALAVFDLSRWALLGRIGSLQQLRCRVGEGRNV